MLHVAGVIFNRVGSDHHEELLREAVAPLGVPVLGALRRDERVVAPERHLGLVPAGEREQRTRVALDTLAGAVECYADVAAIEALARAAPPLAGGPAWSAEPPSPPAAGARIAIARGPAFSFHYEENLELLAAAGAELAPFDPLHDEALPPDCGALSSRAASPRSSAPQLEANAPLRADVAAFVAAGQPVLAECGGLLVPVLRARRPRDVRRDRGRARAWPAASRSATARRSQRPRPRGSRRASASAGTSSTTRASSRSREARAGRALRRGSSQRAGQRGAEGFVAGALQASYLHVHWAAHPQLALRFARAARAAQLAAA